MRTEITSLTVLAGLFALAFATPARHMTLADRQATLVCASGTPQCCDVDVLGVADLDCETPPTVPTTVANFTSICADVGKIDKCCLIPILEQGLICSDPI
ncbi:Bhp2, hydrophobin class II [Mollisia scopiformis]|uniref:Bhp2, hydrophobin class II n=1 Tax=Mollisia scopiformis TaxID=149040 RepID=A0A194XJH5_MOLSC|nr:Bhp2, hydrophobin class II [Mollisia scopiformis]KUJ20303.1 Bhp2, hydrophobin class II [Mollisia scopiformis]